MFETVVSGLVDAFPRYLSKKRAVLTFSLSIASYLISLPVATRVSKIPAVLNFALSIAIYLVPPGTRVSKIPAVLTFALSIAICLVPPGTRVSNISAVLTFALSIAIYLVPLHVATRVSKYLQFVRSLCSALATCMQAVLSCSYHSE